MASKNRKPKKPRPFRRKFTGERKGNVAQCCEQLGESIAAVGRGRDG